MTPIKPFHFGPESDNALLDLFEAWLQLTALLEASTSILAQGGFNLTGVKLAIDRGDRAFVAILRRDRIEDRLS